MKAKRKNIESDGELVEIEGKKRIENVKGPTFEIKEYEFSEVQEASSDRFK